MKLCANLTWLFKDLPAEDRFAAAKDAGFDGIEILDPYDLNIQEVVSELGRFGLSMVLFNCPPPNYTGGEPGWAAVKGSRFQSDLRRALRYSSVLKSELIHLMAGSSQGEEARGVFVENLKSATLSAPDQVFTIEPLNQMDRPGYFLSDYYQAKEIVEEVAAPNLGLQFDTYHVAKTHGDILTTWSAVKDTVRHVQIGEAPDRIEPTSHGPFFEKLREDGYAHWISAEYQPTASTLSSLEWIRAAKE